MRNKKLVAVAMTSMMVCAMGTNVCAASPIENLQGTDSKEVKATYETQDKAETCLLYTSRNRACEPCERREIC